MSENREKGVGENENNAGADQSPQRPAKKPYIRPVLVVLGKIGQIVSNN